MRPLLLPFPKAPKVSSICAAVLALYALLSVACVATLGTEDNAVSIESDAGSRLDDISNSNQALAQTTCSCSAGFESSAGLCYPACPAGHISSGSVCLAPCPSGLRDLGTSCQRDASILSANNSRCPWYDQCGLTFARGCSICPSGTTNSGCTCNAPALNYPKTATARTAVAPTCVTSESGADRLYTNEYLAPGQYLVSPSREYFAIMQGDGDLVVYVGSGPGDNRGLVWQTGRVTSDGTPTFAIMQGDGNFVIYRGTSPGDNRGLAFQTATAEAIPDESPILRLTDDATLVIEVNGCRYYRNYPLQSLDRGTCVSRPDRLNVGQYLKTNEFLVAQNGKYFAALQGDGNFVVYAGNGPGNNLGFVWSTGTDASDGNPSFAIMQGDGNFVLYRGTWVGDNRGFEWATHTAGNVPDEAPSLRLMDDGTLSIEVKNCRYYNNSPHQQFDSETCGVPGQEVYEACVREVTGRTTLTKPSFGVEGLTGDTLNRFKSCVSRSQPFSSEHPWWLAAVNGHCGNPAPAYVPGRDYNAFYQCLRDRSVTPRLATLSNEYLQQASRYCFSGVSDAWAEVVRISIAIAGAANTAYSLYSLGTTTTAAAWAARGTIIFKAGASQGASAVLDSYLTREAGNGLMELIVNFPPWGLTDYPGFRRCLSDRNIADITFKTPKDSGNDALYSAWAKLVEDHCYRVMARVGVDEYGRLYAGWSTGDYHRCLADRDYPQDSDATRLFVSTPAQVIMSAAERVCEDNFNDCTSSATRWVRECIASRTGVAASSITYVPETCGGQGG